MDLDRRLSGSLLLDLNWSIVDWSLIGFGSDFSLLFLLELSLGLLVSWLSITPSQGEVALATWGMVHLH
jgi:hypothetical protein